MFIHARCNGAERVKIGFPLRSPIRKLDTKLETGVSFSDEIFFIDLQRTQHFHKGWNCGLANANCTNLVRLNQLYPAKLPVQLVGQNSGGNPAGSSATNNNNFFERSGHSDILFLLLFHEKNAYAKKPLRVFYPRSGLLRKTKSHSRCN